MTHMLVHLINTLRLFQDLQGRPKKKDDWPRFSDLQYKNDDGDDDDESFILGGDDDDDDRMLDRL